MTDKKSILLVGGGGHCRSCIDVIEAGNEFSIAGIVEQPGKAGDGEVLGYPVLGDDHMLPNLIHGNPYALVTIGQMGSSRVREKMFETLAAIGFVLPVIISPRAYVSRHAVLAPGTIVMHGVMVNAGARVGRNCILNTRCLVEHDVVIGSHCHISTGAIINGGVGIGSGSFVGSNATVVNGLNLPDRYFYKAGSLVAGKDGGRPIQE